LKRFPSCPLEGLAVLKRLLAALLLAFPVAARAQGSPTVVILVRHAEKGTTPAGDPPLTEAGAARARALVAALADANVQAVITTQLARTRDTGRPIAEERHITPEVVPAGGPVHAQAVADAVRKHAGQTILVVGHSNTVPAIIAALGGPKLPDLCDSQYSDLYTLVLDGASARLVRGSYGVASPDPASGCASAMR
jgi:phosphohistidine phosphatase SixA